MYMLLNKLVSMAVLRSNELFTIDEDKEVHVKKDSSFVKRIRSLSTPDANNNDNNYHSQKGSHGPIGSFSDSFFSSAFYYQYNFGF